MIRQKHWASMGEHAKKAMKIVPPYAKKLEKCSGWAVYAPIEINVGQGRTMTIMSPIKKCKTEKEAQNVLKNIS